MSKQWHFYEIEAGADHSRAMESETIRKNGASPKSLMSRGNFFDMKKIVFFVFTLMGLGAMNLATAQTLCDPVMNVAVEQGWGGCTAIITWDSPYGAKEYGVYRGVSLLDFVTEPQYVDEDLPSGTYIWTITAVYDDCESLGVNVIETLTCCLDASVTTQDATNVTQLTATLNGYLYGNSNYCIIDKGFEYKLDNASVWEQVYVLESTLTYNLTGLILGATYQFRAFLTTAGVGTIYGYPLSFTTLPVIVTTLDATNITSSDATLNGITNLDDVTVVVNQGFILTTPTGDETITVSNNTTNLTYDVTDLQRATTYSYKAYCTTASGTIYGEEVKFTTPFNQDGTTNLIENIDDMLALAKLVEEGYSFEGQKFKLVNSITLPTTPNNINAIGRYDDNPPNRRPFCGEFDGNDKAIYNVYIDHPNTPYQGLFGYALNADIHNLGIINITASGRNYTGGMIAYAANSKITDCYVSGGTLYALSYCGGLIGYQTSGTNSIITSCYNNFCTVSGNNYVGGLLGYSDKGTVRNSYVATPVTGIPGTTGAIIGGALDVLFYNWWYNNTITDLPPIGENLISGKRGDGDGGMSSEEMRTEEFVNTLNQGLVIPAWKMDYNPPINDGFPILIWQQQATGIGDLVTESNIILYPNPTSGELWISDMRCATCDIAIFDVMGRTVHVETLRATSLQSHIANRTSHIEMDISHLPTGVYFIRIQTDNGVVTRKVVKSEL